MRRYGIFIAILIPCLLFGNKAILKNIGVFGNRITKRHVILRELHMRSGHPVTDSLMISDRSWLIRTDFLNKIDFQLKPDKHEGHNNLLVVVQEKGHWSFMPSFHTNDLFGIYGGGSLKYRNLWGLRQKITLKIETGGKNKANLTWLNPWFAGRLHLFSSLSLYVHEMPYPYTDYSTKFLETTQGIELKLGKQIGRQVQYGIHTSWEEVQTDLAEVMFSVKKSDQLFTSGVYFNVDTRDWPAYPRDGYFFEASIDHTIISSNRQYQFAMINLRKYFPVKRSDIFAIQFLVHGFHQEIPVYKRLHLGGGDTVRGIPTGYMAGDRLVMANLEYRFPIMYERNFEENLHIGYAGVLFLDAGSAWFSKDAWTINNLRSAVGIGVHAIWDNYVIRGEYGTRGKGWGFINIGTSVHF